MYSNNDFYPGRKVVKIISCLGTETASIREIVKINKKKGFAYLDEQDICDDGQNTYKIANGRANVCHIPGFSHRIIPLEE